MTPNPNLRSQQTWIRKTWFILMLFYCVSFAKSFLIYPRPTFCISFFFLWKNKVIDWILCGFAKPSCRRGQIHHLWQFVWNINITNKIQVFFPLPLVHSILLINYFSWREKSKISDCQAITHKKKVQFTFCESNN